MRCPRPLKVPESDFNYKMMLSKYVSELPNIQNDAVQICEWIAKVFQF